jgi:hypothetical protein
VWSGDRPASASAGVALTAPPRDFRGLVPGLTLVSSLRCRAVSADEAAGARSGGTEGRGGPEAPTRPGAAHRAD